MKRVSYIFLMLIFSVVLSGITFNEAESLYTEYNSNRKADLMKGLIELLNAESPGNPVLYKILSTALFRLADWGILKTQERVILYQEAIDAGKKAVEHEPESAMANYALGLSFGRLAQITGGIGAAFLLGDFEKFINKSLKIDPTFYLAQYALGMRYKDAPWPMNDTKKAENYFKNCISINSEFLNAYYDLGLLYFYDGKKEEAIKFMNYTIAMPVNPEWIEESLEIKRLTSEFLKYNN